MLGQLCHFLCVLCKHAKTSTKLQAVRYKFHPGAEKGVPDAKAWARHINLDPNMQSASAFSTRSATQPA